MVQESRAATGCRQLENPQCRPVVQQSIKVSDKSLVIDTQPMPKKTDIEGPGALAEEVRKRIVARCQCVLGGVVGVHWAIGVHGGKRKSEENQETRMAVLPVAHRNL